MKKSAGHPELLPLLVSVYNQSIQTYHYFPEVIICGRQRLEKEAFDQLLAQDFVRPYAADSFGRWYRLTKKGEDFLFQFLFRRRQKHHQLAVPLAQPCLPFAEGC